MGTNNNKILSEKEKEEAKQNSFILVGKTGSGKTTLLNALFNRIVGNAERTSESVTKKCSLYYYILKNKKIVCLIDTPGLSDTGLIENENKDKINLDEINEIIKDETIKIIGILYLINFQNERFDADEQKVLLSYNKLFSYKNFWKILVIIYTHYYNAPFEDKNIEIIKNDKNANNKELFDKMMEKSKEISDIIPYDSLKKIYLNSFSEPKKHKQKKNNERARKELEIIFNFFLFNIKK